MNTSTVQVRYDVLEFDDDRTLVIRAASRDTAYDMVVVELAHYPIHNNAFVVALVNLGSAGYVWNLPRLTGWHWSYLAERAGMSRVTAETVAAILDHAAVQFEREA